MTKNHTTTAEIHEDDRNADGAVATYCAQDDKIRLYVGRVERTTYNFLRVNKFVATPKQSCDFVAVWSPNAEDIAFDLIAEDRDIEDEDYSPEERAADRAERFAGYRDKRSNEAHGHADTYEDGPSAFGNQNARRAERQASRHERHRDRALCQWSKAEYWQTRTAGVISNALHRSDASTRRGRILTLEAEVRQIEARYTPKENATQYTDEADGRVYVYCTPGGRGGEWVAVDRLEERKAAYARTIEHLQRRLIYENAMLANEGGTAAAVEMIPGGWIGKHQIYKINTSPATGRVVSVNFGLNRTPRNIERLGADAYRAPTPEELTAFAAKLAAQKADTRAAASTAASLINPTLEDAQRLCDIWNAHKKTTDKQATPAVMTQALYSARSKGEYGQCKTVTITERALQYHQNYNGIEWNGHSAICKLRIFSGGFDGCSRPVVISDKPQKSLPFDMMTETGDNPPSRQAAAESLHILNDARRGKNWFSDMDADARALWLKAASWGFTTYSSESQFSITEAGRQILNTTPAPEPVAEIETPEPAYAAAQELVTAPAGCLF